MAKKLLTKQETQNLVDAVWAGKLTESKLPDWLFDKLSDGFTQAASAGWGNPLGEGTTAQDKILEAALQENLFYFAARKTAHQLKEMQQLMTASGSKYEFAKQAIKLDEKWNYHWYNTEANVTQRLARAGREWQRLEATADIYPLLRFVAVQDSNTRDEHRALHGIVQPVESDFWNKYMPPLDWNCRCMVERVTDDGTPETDISDRTDLPPTEPQFTDRVTESKRIWHESHPYFDQLSAKAEKAVAKLVQAKQLSIFDEPTPEMELLQKLDEVDNPRTTAEEMLKDPEVQRMMDGAMDKDDKKQWIKDHHAKTKNYKPFTFYRYDGAGEGYAGVGNGLYLGRDQKALFNFYNDFGDRELPLHTYEGNPKWLDIMDPRKEKIWNQYLKDNNIDPINSDKVSGLVKKLGFDGIRYYDPMATGEEFVLFNTKAVKRVEAPKPKAKPAPKHKPETHTDYNEASFEAHKHFSQKPDDTQTVKDYTSRTYQRINKVQRNGTLAPYFDERTADDIRNDKEAKKLAKKLDEALKNAPKYQGVTYRGVGLMEDDPGAVITHNKLIANAKRGIFIDKGFLSSSIKIEEALAFMETHGELHILYKINGKTGVPISRISNHPDEDEVLFNRNSKFRVTNITKPASHVTEITLEEI